MSRRDGVVHIDLAVPEARPAQIFLPPYRPIALSPFRPNAECHNYLWRGVVSEWSKERAWKARTR